MQNREDLKEMRSEVTKTNENVDLLSKVIAKVLIEMGYVKIPTPSIGMGLIEKPTDKQVLKRYLES